MGNCYNKSIVKSFTTYNNNHKKLFKFEKTLLKKVIF